MNAARIKMLETFRAEDPTDPFPVYALALEYQQTDREKARQLFELLLDKYADYLPTYYMAGNFFMEQDDLTRAGELWQHGLVIAKAQADYGTMKELQAALDALE
ncbi:MAG: tetratricopeptide repeat protein [Cyclobacteriaceae bacterium]|nr:tetratricopeptide repeat protein [Cyclobacteriaceae bacterium]